MKRWIIFALGGSAVALGLAACATSRAGYESAPYAVVQSAGIFEVRDYPTLTTATTAMDSSGSARDDRFMRLFRYIDGGNAASQKVAMTTPVFMTAPSAGASKAEPSTMAFVLPSDVAAAGAPTPQSSEVVLRTLPARRVAVVRFNGVSNRQREQAKLEELTAWVQKQGLSVAGDPFFAYYDPPWTPGPLRRNEVFLALRK